MKTVSKKTGALKKSLSDKLVGKDKKPRRFFMTVNKENGLTKTTNSKRQKITKAIATKVKGKVVEVSLAW